MDLWRARPGDVIVLPVWPGEVTVTDALAGERAERTRVEFEAAGGLSGSVELSDFIPVAITAAGDGMNEIWLATAARKGN